MIARILLPLLCLLPVACSMATLPSGSPEVQGTVISLLPDQRALIQATVRPPELPDTFYVNPGDRVLIRQADGTLRRGNAGDIQVGDHLRAWLTGVELRSLPPQYPARILEVVRVVP